MALRIHAEMTELVGREAGQEEDVATVGHVPAGLHGVGVDRQPARVEGDCFPFGVQPECLERRGERRLGEIRGRGSASGGCERDHECGDDFARPEESRQAQHSTTSGRADTIPAGTE